MAITKISYIQDIYTGWVEVTAMVWGVGTRAASDNTVTSLTSMDMISIMTFKDRLGSSPSS